MDTPTAPTRPPEIGPEGQILGPLQIQNLWHGRPGTAKEVAYVHLRGRPDHLEVTVDATFHEDPAPDAPPGSFPGLWEFEVVELFIGGADGSYLEVELGPRGHHLVLRLSGVRQIAEQGLPLDYRTAVTSDLWTGMARIPRSLLPPGPHTLNLTAIHGQHRKPGQRRPGGGRRYLSWAPLRGEVPDFHQPDRWIPVQLP
jgi:hypothetical protein